MTDTPEKIWTTGNSQTGSWNNVDTERFPTTKYTRDDTAQARIEELYAQAINFRESIRKAALDSEHGHEILDLCWDSYFPEMPVAGVHRFVLKETS
jgi:hypothetical protein